MERPSKTATLAGAIAIALAATEPAQSEWLTRDNDIKSLVDGKRVYLSVPLGGEFPLYYRSSGQVTGDGSALGLGRFLAPKETGRWWVSRGRLCQKFPTWYDGKITCFRLRPTGEAKLRWRRDDGYSGRARIQP